jgi:hypothetical protein
MAVGIVSGLLMKRFDIVPYKSAITKVHTYLLILR